MPVDAAFTEAVQALPPTAPPVRHEGSERPIPRLHDAAAQNACDRDKKKRHMLKNLLLMHQTLRILFLSETHPGRVLDKLIAARTPYPLRARGQRLQDLGFQAFTRDGVDILQPVQKPRGHELTPAQNAGNRELARRRVRSEQGSWTSSSSL